MLHAGGIAALLLLRQDEALLVKPVAIAVDVSAPKKLRMASPLRGGGGGEEARPASRGRLPRRMEVAFTPPTTWTVELEPALPMEPALQGPATPVVSGPIGDPFGVPGPPSDGRGKRGGIGDGDRRGVGDGEGPRAYAMSAVSSAPVLIYKVEPEFSEEARRARFNGLVVLRVVIDEKGTPTRIEVVQSPGLGLAERAVASVAQWRFRPGRMNGRPVAVWATVEVSFSLL